MPRRAQEIARCARGGAVSPARVTQVFGYEGRRRTEWEEGCAGDIVAVPGLPEVGIGDTLAGRDDPRPLPPIHVDEPTIAMVIGINTSPMAGREGQHVTSRKLKE